MLAGPPLRFAAQHFIALQSGFIYLRAGTHGPLTMDQYLAVPHLLLSPSGVLRGQLDDTLASLGARRQVVAAVSHFSTLPFALRKMAALTNMPSIAAYYYAKAFRLARSPLPFEPPRFEVALLWHARLDADPAVAWFRGRVRSLVRALRLRAQPP